MQQSGHGSEPALRFAISGDLLAGLPQLSQEITTRPDDINQPVMDFVQTLHGGKTPEEALTVCAYALAPRFSVWWGHECLIRVKDGLSADDIEFLQMTSDWVADPSEERRSAIVERAYPGDTPVSPGQWVALGAGWTDGSMNPSNMPDLPPAPHLTPTAVQAGILCALATVDIASRDATLASFVKMARQLAQAT